MADNDTPPVDDTPPADDTPPVDDTPPADEPPDPEQWRERYIETRKGDDKMMKQLQRFASPDAVIDSVLSLKQQISAGEFVPRLPKDAKPEELAKWRTDIGVPEKPDGYDIKLRDGLGDENDKEIVDSFLESAHKSNMTSAQASEQLSWFYENAETALQQRSENDDINMQEVEDVLRVEWGTDYRGNKAKIEAFLDTGPEGVKVALFEARSPDGSLLANNPDVIRFWVDKARELNPTITVVPGEGAEQAQGIADEMKELMLQAGAPKGTKEHTAYWKGGGQQRYNKLVDASMHIESQKRKAG